MHAFDLSGHRLACSSSVASRSAYESLVSITSHYSQHKVVPTAIRLYPDQLEKLRCSLRLSGFEVQGQQLAFQGFPLVEVSR